MYFLFFKLHWGSKRSAAQPKTIYSEVPKSVRKQRGLEPVRAAARYQIL